MQFRGPPTMPVAVQLHPLCPRSRCSCMWGSLFCGCHHALSARAQFFLLAKCPPWASHCLLDCHPAWESFLLFIVAFHPSNLVVSSRLCEGHSLCPSLTNSLHMEPHFIRPVTGQVGLCRCPRNKGAVLLLFPLRCSVAECSRAP